MAGFLYLEVPVGDPSDVDDPFAVFQQPRYHVERNLLASALVRVERQDLVDGRRVFRVIEGEQKKLLRDNQGPYVLDTTGGKIKKLRFSESDPSAGQAVLRTWVNTRS